MKTQQTYQQWQDYKELEPIPTSTASSKTRLFPVIAFLNRVWGQTKTILALTNEPMIRETIDRAGNTHWWVYDPDRELLLHFDSPEDVQLWLEERHQHSNRKGLGSYW